MIRPNEKVVIGIDECAKCPVIGSIPVALIMLPKRLLRKFAHLPIRDSKLLSRKQIETVVKFTRKETFVSYRNLRPIDLEEAGNQNALEMMSVIDLLNEIEKFWEHEIYIDNWEVSREKFIDRWSQLEPNNLRKVDLKMDKWKIEHECERYKACALASIYSRFNHDLEYDDIRRTYGDFGSGAPSDPKTIKFVIENPTCPWIKNTFVTVQRLKDNPELKKEVLKLVSQGKTKGLKELYDKYEIK